MKLVAPILVVSFLVLLILSGWRDLRNPSRVFDSARDLHGDRYARFLARTGPWAKLTFGVGILIYVLLLMAGVVEVS
jgi:hypothetical protein